MLHVGDSFADALGGALRVELEREGIRAINRAKTGSYIPEWAGIRSDVPALVKVHNPDLVIITLGGNELKLRDPASRAEAIRRLVGFVGDRPCVWVAPSLWKSAQNALITETGLLQVIRDNAKPCRYFDTNAIVPNLERTGDHVHPSIPARRIWARAFVEWLEHERDPAGSRPWQLRPEEGGDPQ